MKSRELLSKYPMTFLVWSLNEDTGVFWVNLTTLEDNGFFDPWGQRVILKTAQKVKNRWDEVTEFRIESEFQGYPIELVVINE